MTAAMRQFSSQDENDDDQIMAAGTSNRDAMQESLQIGIIGMGDMGRLYTNKFIRGGWKHINVCDRLESFEKLSAEFKDQPAVNVMPDGHYVSRVSDFIIYSVEAASMNAVVRQYGPSIKVGAIVSGQTSVKAPEKEAFEKHLPKDVAIISCHSLHGPKVDTIGQPLVLIKHRATTEQFEIVQRIFECFQSKYVFLNTYEDHDIVTANTQAVTHAAFLTMGQAWRCSQAYPWETGMYPGGVETVKINIMLRIYAAKWHVYAGLAILNPAARMQVKQYATSATELFKLMVAGDETALAQRVFAARRAIFELQDNEDGEGGKHARKPILMSDTMLDEFHLAAKRVTNADSTSAKAPPPNSHLALLAIVDCWHQLGIDPYAHLSVAATPVFRIWIGVCEYLFRSPERVKAAIHAGIYDSSFRSDDTEFVIAARQWSECVEFGNFDLYRWQFEKTSSFFESRFDQANKLGTAMLKVVLEQQDRKE